MRFEFTRTFTKGLLQGITQVDSISFPDRDSYDQWLEKMRWNHISGHLNYFVIDTTNLRKEAK